MRGKKTGGRKPGVKNRITVEMSTVLRKLKFDPVTWAVRVARGDELFKTPVYRGRELGSEIMELPAPPEVRAKAALSLLPYVHPQRKAIEFRTKDGETLIDSFKGAVTPRKVRGPVTPKEGDEEPIPKLN